MKKLIKFILILVLIIIVVAVGSVIAVYASLSNDTDATPKEIYTAEANKSTIISETLSAGFDLSSKNYIDITLDETQLNLLIFCIIREKINNDYLPVATGDVDYNNKANYVWKASLPANVPLLAGKGILIKSIYSKISDEKLMLFMPAIIGNKISCVELYLSFEEDNDAFYLLIDTLKIGKVNYAGKGAKRIIKVASSMGLTDKSIEDKLNNNELQFDVDLSNLKIGLTKDSLQAFLSKLITDNVTSSEVTASTLNSLAQMLTSKENDMLDLGVFNDRFGVRCDLSKADVDSEQLLLNPEYENFDENLYITTITQSFAISNLGSDDKKVTISEEDFNAMIFAKSNGYHDFKVDFPIPGTDTSIGIAVNGIDVDLASEIVTIEVIFDLNGLKTVIEVTGRVSGNNSNRVLITLDQEIKIGKGNSEATASYIKANSDFIKVILAEKISEIEMMDYDKEANALVLSADNFNEMLSVTGGSALPLGVDKLNLTDSGLEVYVTITNPVVAASLEVVSNAISDFLESSSLTANDFDTNDPEQAAAVNNVLDLIASSGDAISSGDLDEEDTNSLIEAISGLSDENKEVLYSSIEDSMSTNDLTDLYNSLFGR